MSSTGRAEETPIACGVLVRPCGRMILSLRCHMPSGWRSSIRDGGLFVSEVPGGGEGAKPILRFNSRQGPMGFVSGHRPSPVEVAVTRGIEAGGHMAMDLAGLQGIVDVILSVWPEGDALPKKEDIGSVGFEHFMACIEGERFDALTKEALALSDVPAG